MYTLYILLSTLQLFLRMHTNIHFPDLIDFRNKLKICHNALNLSKVILCEAKKNNIKLSRITPWVIHPLYTLDLRGSYFSIIPFDGTEDPAPQMLSVR